VLPNASRSAAIIGVSHTSRLRPARLSLNFRLAAKVDDPVATTRTLGKWSAATLRTSDGFVSRWISSRTTVDPGRLVAPEELGILECMPYPDEFAVEVANPGQ